MREIDVCFQKIAFDGRTFGRHNGKIVFCYGVLPNETAKVRITREKRDFIEGELIQILEPSGSRVHPKEDHYISCSPWQIMDYEYQCKLKKNMAIDIFYQATKETLKLDEFYPASQIFNYRTKIEYSFCETENGKLALAFYKRGTYKEKIILPGGCALISEKTNKIALEILEFLNNAQVAEKDLKALVIRESKNTQERIAILYVRDRNIKLKDCKFDGLDGFILAYSNPLSPVSKVDEIIFKSGADFITEKLTLPYSSKAAQTDLGTQAGGEAMNFYFSYPFDSFFQNNIELFEKALGEIKNSCFKCLKILDLFSGVGVLAIILKDFAQKIYGVESHAPSVEFARLNAEKNLVNNFEILCMPAEKTAMNLFENTDIVILDPPRAGLHKNVINNIMKTMPRRIIYLSCNPLTQARDAVFFLEKYKIMRAVAFDFYPNTPNMETMLVFDKN